MGAVLWSAVLHAILHSTQPLQPLNPFTVRNMPEALSTMCKMGLYQANEPLRPLCLTRVAHKAHFKELGLFSWPGWYKRTGSSILLQLGQ